MEAAVIDGANRKIWHIDLLLLTIVSSSFSLAVFGRGLKSTAAAKSAQYGFSDVISPILPSGPGRASTALLRRWPFNNVISFLMLAFVNR